MVKFMADPPVGAATKDYERGKEAGEIAGQISARLAGHDRHFESINGSIAKVGAELHVITMAVQRLADQAVARDATTVATAKALREADETRRANEGDTWTPWQRMFAVIAACAALVGIGATLLVYAK